MKHRRSSASLSLVLGLTALSTASAVAPRPNVLVVLADDVGWGDFSCYNPEGRIKTPNIDRLAREGMRFTDAHTPSALCAPTRYSVLTGNYPWRGRLPNGTWGFSDTPQILPDQRTIGHVLQEVGYHTAMLGKGHLGGTFVHRPDGSIDWGQRMVVGGSEWGFDYSFLLLGGHQAPPYCYIENNRVVGDPAKIIQLAAGPLNGGAIEKAGPGFADWDSRAVGETLLGKAIEFLDRHVAEAKTSDQERPFFLHFNTDGAHSPFTPPEFIAGTPVAGVTKMTPHTDTVYEVDVLVGKLVEALAKRGLLSNTLIVVTSDNGGIPEERQFGHDASGGLTGRKMSIWEGGHRVPLVVHWGDGTPRDSKIAPGIERHQMVGVHDIFATIAELAGATVPADQALDSISWAPVLIGARGDDQPVRQTLFMQSGPIRNGTQMPMPEGEAARWAKESELKAREIDPAAPPQAFALREGPWKLIVDPEGKPNGLFHLDRDLKEKNNLVDDPQHASRVVRMLELLQDLLKSKRSTLPISPAAATTVDHGAAGAGL
jgi:arylsulfatase A-like enzyme